MHELCKSYGDFAEWVDFASWWSCIGKGLRLQPARQAFFLSALFSKRFERDLIFGLLVIVLLGLKNPNIVSKVMAI